MAANDYYASSHARPYHDYPDRLDATLPPLPSQSPVSPLDNGTYPYSHPAPSSSYSGASGRLHDDPDPYEDSNAIPLNGRRGKHESTQTISPILSHHAEDPYARHTDPRKRKREKGIKGWFSGQVTWVVFVLSFVELIVFIVELIKNGVATGTPIEIHPSFNPMIGPSPYMLINMGARYQPCMHNMPNVQNATEPISWPCPWATSLTGADVNCTLADLCGFGGVPNPHPGGSIHDSPSPNQWYRFIVPIFLHAGIIHIGFNLLLQLTLGRDIEKLIGSVRFAIVYFASGIFGFVLGGNFAANGIASTGCSGSLFGILAITLLDLLYTWKERQGPIKDLLFIVVDVCIAFVLGLLPGLDNFSHIGGFLMGLVLGICILRSPKAIARRISQLEPITNSYELARPDVRNHGIREFIKDPLGFFKDRQGVWWAWWFVRAAALVGALVAFILLLKNFYVWNNGCSWCKYLSCLPIKVGSTDWCTVGNLNFTPNNNTLPAAQNRTSRRDVFETAGAVLDFAQLL